MPIPRVSFPFGAREGGTILAPSRLEALARWAIPIIEKGVLEEGVLKGGTLKPGTLDKLRRLLKDHNIVFGQSRAIIELAVGLSFIRPVSARKTIAVANEIEKHPLPLPQEEEPHWAFDGEMDERLYMEMGCLKNFKSARVNSSSTHQARVNSLITNVLRKLGQKETVVVFGAARFGFDLAPLARDFKNVIFIDTNQEALEKARLKLDRGLFSHIDLSVMDITGVGFQYVRAVERLFESEKNPEEAFEKLPRLTEVPLLTGSSPFSFLDVYNRADLVISNMVLSDLSETPLSYAEKLLRKCSLGNFFSFTTDSRWQAAREAYIIQREKEHLDAIARYSKLAVLISDTSQYKAGPSTAPPQQSLSRQSLSHLLPVNVQTIDRQTWEWDQGRRWRLPGTCNKSVEAVIFKTPPP